MSLALGVNNETVALLGLTTYLLGFGCGSVIWASLSETFGRRPVYIATLFAFMCFILMCALAQNMTMMLIARFFAGMTGVSALSNSSGTINDMVHPKSRALAFSFWSIGVMVRQL